MIWLGCGGLYPFSGICSRLAFNVLIVAVIELNNMSKVMNNNIILALE